MLLFGCVQPLAKHHQYNWDFNISHVVVILQNHPSLKQLLIF